MTSVKEFYQPHQEDIWRLPGFRESLLSVPYIQQVRTFYANIGDEELLRKVFSIYLEEAQATLNLLTYDCWEKGKTLLEVGGGLGLVYGFLRSRGFDICSIEPSKGAFAGFYAAGRELLRYLKIDQGRWHCLSVKECSPMNQRFDIIFSHNVFEHVSDPSETLAVLRQMLKPNGKMLHRTVNYFIPYDPHFRILLFPWWPQMSCILNPRLKENLVWREINFVTAQQIKKICDAQHLKIQFERDAFWETFTRLANDPEFTARHPTFYRLYHFLKKNLLLKFLTSLPPEFLTPMKFTITLKD